MEPRSIEVARKFGVAVHVRSSFESRPGTWIGKEIKMECLSENPFTPERRAANAKGCEIEKTQTPDKGTAWKMRCKTPTGEVEGSGNYQSTGDTARGLMTTTMRVGDHSLVTETRWEGVRLGECGMERPKQPKKIIGSPKANRSPKPAGKQAPGAVPGEQQSTPKTSAE